MCPTATEAFGDFRGEGSEFGGFRLGEEEFFEVAYLERRMERVSAKRESGFESTEDSLRASDAEKLRPGREAKKLRLDGFVLGLRGVHIVHEVAPGDGSAGNDHSFEFAEKIEYAVLSAPNVEFVEEARRIREVEGTSLERKVESVATGEARTDREFARGEGRFGVGDSIFVFVEDGEGAGAADSLGETFDPQRGSPSGVKNVSSAYVAEEIEFAVGEGDEVVFVFVALAW
jgi:hypothetical protein